MEACGEWAYIVTTERALGRSRGEMRGQDQKRPCNAAKDKQVFEGQG